MTLPEISEPDERLLRAAARLFRANGLAATTIRAIADAAGMLPGSVTYRYPAKEDLLVALISRTVERATTDLWRAIEGVDDPLLRLRRALRAHLKALLDGDDAVYVLLFDWPRLSPSTRERLVVERQRYEAIWSGLIYAAAASGQLAEGLDLSLVRRLVFGAASSVAFWYRPSGPRAPEELADAIAALVGMGLLAEKARPSSRSEVERALAPLRADRPVQNADELEVAKDVSPVPGASHCETYSDRTWLQIPEPGWAPLDLSAWPDEGFLNDNGTEERVLVRYYQDGVPGTLHAKAIFGRNAQGPPGHAHGGSIAALLDETMGLTVWASGIPTVAAELTTKYKRMVPLGGRCRVHAEIDEVDGRKIRTRGTVRAEDGTLHSEGSALFIEVDPRAFDEYPAPPVRYAPRTRSSKT